MCVRAFKLRSWENTCTCILCQLPHLTLSWPLSPPPLCRSTTYCEASSSSSFFFYPQSATCASSNPSYLQSVFIHSPLFLVCVKDACEFGWGFVHVYLCVRWSEINRNSKHKYIWKATKQTLNVKVLKSTKESSFLHFHLVKSFSQIFMRNPFVIPRRPLFTGAKGWDCFECSVWRKLSRYEADQTMENSAWSSRKCWLHIASSRTKCWPYANTNCCHQKIEQPVL